MLKRIRDVLMIAAICLFGAESSEGQVRFQDWAFGASDLGPCQFFGKRVASSGEWMFVASHTCDSQGFLGAGTITVFRRGPFGVSWFQEFDSGDPFFGEGFGNRGLEADGNVLAVTSSAYPDQFHPEGRVCVFEFNGTDWQRTAVLIQTTSFPQDGYGTKIAVSGDKIFVGAPGLPQSFGVGGVYVYEKLGGGWIEMDVWSYPNLPTFSTFPAGAVMGADSETLVMGRAFPENLLYIIEKDSTGIWALTQSVGGFPAPLSLPTDQSGWDIAVDGDVIAVGADENIFFVVPGEVRIFRRTNGIWAHDQRILAPNPTGGADGFGVSVDLEGDRLIVGSNQIGERGGAAYVYKENAAGVFELEWELLPRFPVLFGEFGTSVALSWPTALVGDRVGPASPWEFTGEGSAHMFDLPMGEGYCPGVVNSTGAAGGLEVVGSLVAEERFLRLRATGLPSGNIGMFLGAAARGFVPNLAGSQGNYCLGGAFVRFNGIGQIAAIHPDGVQDLLLDTTVMPFAPEAPLLAGQTWTFQYWYRDLNPGAATNFTSAIEVLFE